MLFDEQLLRAFLRCRDMSAGRSPAGHLATNYYAGDWMFGDVQRPLLVRYPKYTFLDDRIVAAYEEASRDDVRSVELGARWRMIHGHPWAAEDP